MDHLTLQEHACQMAKRSPQKRYKTGAVICDKAGNILSTGWSHMSGNLLANYWSVHAEFHALQRAHDRDGAAVVYIATLNPSGNLCSGRPCLQCAKLLSDAGISWVHFSMTGGYWDLIQLKELESFWNDLKRYPTRSEIVQGDLSRRLRNAVAD